MVMEETDSSHEKKNSYFPLNPDRLIGTPYFMVYHHPHITGLYNSLYTLNNEGYFFIAQIDFYTTKQSKNWILSKHCLIMDSMKANF